MVGWGWVEGEDGKVVDDGGSLDLYRTGLRYCLCLILSYECFDADDIQHLESRVY